MGAASRSSGKASPACTAGATSASPGRSRGATPRRGEGRGSASSDVDLLVSFSSPAVSLISLARALEAMEDSLGVSVDLVQEPLPQGSLLTIGKAVPLYGAA